jgi:hypothetical protein
MLDEQDSGMAAQGRTESSRWPQRCRTRIIQGKKKAKKAARSLLTAAQKKLPQDLQDKIAKSKMRSA